MAKQISTLNVGDVVKSVNTKYNNSVIRFIVGHKTANRVKLITEKIITLKCFDAKEPSNPNSDRQNYGNNRYSQSNIDQWLNSAAGAGAWYSARHTYDAPPNNANVWSNYNEYDAEAGFLSNFEESFRNAILDTTIRVAKNTVTDGGGYEDITRKVYLLSNTEVGLSNENGVAEGSKWDLFSNNNSRKAYPTAEAVSRSEYTNSNLNASSPWYWWLRTPYAGYSYIARVVGTGGTLGNGSAYYGNGGVRPALELDSGILVSDTPDTDGAYIIQWNQPPTIPTSISHGTPRAGQPLTITTGGSTDPEGDPINYVFERRVDTGPYEQIDITSEKTVQDIVPTSGTNYQVRVKAVDSKGAESGYRTGEPVPIVYNTDPVISGTDENLGAHEDPLTYNYTVTDAEAASQTLTVTEKVTNGAETITLRTFTATSGATNTADLSSVWLKLLPGTHTLTITVSDGAGGMAQRVITFSRTITRIAASRAFTTDSLVTKCFLSIYPSERPLDSTLHCEVCNNPFDDEPVWEDITAKVNRYVHTFENNTVATNYGLAYRFYLTKGNQQIEVSQVTVRFA